MRFPPPWPPLTHHHLVFIRAVRLVRRCLVRWQAVFGALKAVSMFTVTEQIWLNIIVATRETVHLPNPANIAIRPSAKPISYLEVAHP